MDGRQQSRALGDSEQPAKLPGKGKHQYVRNHSFYNRRFRGCAHEPPNQHMVFLPEIGSQKRLNSHSYAIHHDAEFYETDDHGQRDQSCLSVPGGNMTDHHVIHNSPAQIDRRVHYAELYALQ